MIVTGEQIAEAALKYKGTKFKKCGRSLEGLDCIGLLSVVAQDLNLDIQDRTDYSFKGESAMMREMVYNQTIKLDSKTPVNGSIVILRQALIPAHVGFIIVNKGTVTVLNANIAKRQVVEDSYSNWKNNVLGIRAFKEMVL